MSELSRMVGKFGPEMQKAMTTIANGAARDLLRTNLKPILDKVFSSDDFPINSKQELTDLALSKTEQFATVINDVLSGKIVGNGSETDTLSDNRDNKIKQLQDLLKSSSKSFVDMPTSFEDAVKWINQNLPLGQAINGKIVKAGSNTANIIKSLAHILNRVGARINVAANRGIDDLARDVSVAFRALSAEYCADFLGYYAALTYALERAKLYNLLIKSLTENMNNLKPEDVGKIQALKISFNSVSNQLNQYLSSMSSILHSEDLMTRINNVYRDPGKGIATLMKINTLTSTDKDAVAQEVMVNMGRISELFKLAAAVESIKKAADPHLTAVLKAFGGVDKSELRRVIEDLSRNGKVPVIKLPNGDVLEASKLGQFFNTAFDRVSHEERRQVVATIDSNDVSRLGVTGSADLTIKQNVQSAIEIAKRTRMELVKRSTSAINEYMRKLIQVIKTICLMIQSGELKVVSELKHFYEGVQALTLLRETGTFAAVSGIYYDSRFQFARNQFMDILDRLKASCDKLGSSNPAFSSCSTIISDFQRHIDGSSTQYKNANPPQPGNMRIQGSAEFDYDITPQLNTVLTAFENVVQELSYSINFHRGLERMKRAGRDLNEASESIKKVRASAVAEKIKEIQQTRDARIATIQHASLNQLFSVSPGNMGADGASKTRNATVEMCKDMYNTQITLLQTAEAIDAVLEKYIRTVANDPTLLRELYREIKDNQGIANWFNEKSGDALVEFYESFPFATNEQGDPVLKAKFVMSGNQHYYDLLMNAYGSPLSTGTHSSSKASNTPFSSTMILGFHDSSVGRSSDIMHSVSMLGLPFSPMFADDYMYMKKKALMAVQSTGALKNLLATFFHIAQKIGGEMMFSFMSPATVYKNLCEYLAVSSMSQGLIGKFADVYPKLDKTVTYLAAGQTGSVHINSMLTQYMGFNQNGYFGNGHMAISRYSTNRLINVSNLDRDSMGQVDIHIGAGMNELQMGISNYKTTHLSYYGVIASAIYPSSDGEYHLQMMRDTDLIFVQIIQSIYSKLMVSIDTYTSLYRPISTDRYHNLRSIIGGNSNVSIDPEYLELYLTLITLSEFYNKIFGFKSSNAAGYSVTNTFTINSLSSFIGVLPETTSKFASFVRIGFLNKEDTNDANYSQLQISSMIEEINRLIASEQGIPEERSVALIDQFVHDVNTRYGLMAVEDAEAYASLVNEQVQKRGSISDYQRNTHRGDGLSILPGEDALFSEWDGPIPSDSYVTPTANDKDSLGEYNMTNKAKAKIQHIYRDVIYTFRDRIEKELSTSSGKTDSTIKMISSMIRDAKYRVSSSKNESEKFLEAYRLITLGHTDTSANITEKIIIQEYYGTLDLLRLLCVQLMTAVEICRVCSSPAKMMKELASVLSNVVDPTTSICQTLGGVYRSILTKFVPEFTSSRYAELLGCLYITASTGGATMDTVISANIINGTTHGSRAPITPGKLRGIPNRTGDCITMLNNAVNDNSSDDYALSLLLIDSVMNYNVMFSSLVNVCNTLSDNANGNDNCLIDLNISNGQFLFNFSKLQDVVTNLFNSLDTLRKMCPNLIPKSEGLSEAKVYEIYFNYLFSSASTENYEYSLHKLSKNATDMFRLLTSTSTVSFSSDKILLASKLTHLTQVHGWTGRVAKYFGTNNINRLPYMDTKSLRTNLDFSLRSLLYFNAYLPNSGIPHTIKELRSEYPIYASAAPSDVKGTTFMFWKLELGFPDLLKMPGSIKEYRVHSLMVELNAILFNLVNEIFDNTGNRIYAKILNAILPSINTTGSLIYSYPDLYPNPLALTSQMAFQSNAATTFVNSLYQSGTNILFGNSTPPSTGYTLADRGLVYSSLFQGLAGYNSDEIYKLPKDGFQISLEQLVIAADLFSSSDYSKYDCAHTDWNYDPTMQVAPAFSTVHHVRYISAFLAGITNYDANTANTSLKNLAQRSHYFIKNLYSRIPDKVPFRSYTPASSIGFGIRRDPKPENPLFASVVCLVTQLLSNKTEKGENINLYVNLEDVPLHNREVIKTKLPYFISLLKVLGSRSSILTKICASCPQFASSLDSRSYPTIDLCDITNDRTTVWGGNFKSNAVTFCSKISEICKQVSLGLVEIYNTLSDQYVYLEPSQDFGKSFESNNGRKQLTPLHLSLIPASSSVSVLDNLSIASSSNIDNYKVLRGLRGIINSCVTQGKNVQSYSNVITLIKQSGELRPIKMNDSDIKQYIENFVDIYRFAIGNRMFKRSYQDEVGFKGYGIATSDLNSVSSATFTSGAGDIKDGQRSNSIVQYIKWLIALGRSIPVTQSDPKIKLILDTITQQQPTFAYSPAKVVSTSDNVSLYVLATLNSAAHVVYDRNYTSVSNLGQGTVNITHSKNSYKYATQSPAYATVESIITYRSIISGYKINWISNDVSMYNQTSMIMHSYTSTTYSPISETLGSTMDLNLLNFKNYMTLWGYIDASESYNVYGLLSNSANNKIDSRNDMVAAVIKKYNIVPINVNLLARDIPFGNLYNSSYNFKKYIATKFGLRSDQITDNLKDTVTINKFIASLLVNPYMPITIFDYETHFASVMKGSSGFDIGRPQYLSDQVYNKCLLGSLYGTSPDSEKGGPATSINRSPNTNYAIYAAISSMIVTAMTNLLIANELKYRERDKLLYEIQKTEGNLWRDNPIRSAGGLSNPYASTVNFQLIYDIYNLSVNSKTKDVARFYTSNHDQLMAGYIQLMHFANTNNENLTVFIRNPQMAAVLLNGYVNLCILLGITTYDTMTFLAISKVCDVIKYNLASDFKTHQKLIKDVFGLKTNVADKDELETALGRKLNTYVLTTLGNLAFSNTHQAHDGDWDFTFEELLKNPVEFAKGLEGRASNELVAQVGRRLNHMVSNLNKLNLIYLRYVNTVESAKTHAVFTFNRSDLLKMYQMRELKKLKASKSEDDKKLYKEMIAEFINKYGDDEVSKIDDVEDLPSEGGLLSYMSSVFSSSKKAQKRTIKAESGDDSKSTSSSIVSSIYSAGAKFLGVKTPEELDQIRNDIMILEDLLQDYYTKINLTITQEMLDTLYANFDTAAMNLKVGDSWANLMSYIQPTTSLGAYALIFNAIDDDELVKSDDYISLFDDLRKIDPSYFKISYTDRAVRSGGYFSTSYWMASTQWGTIAKAAKRREAKQQATLDAKGKVTKPAEEMPRKVAPKLPPPPDSRPLKPVLKPNSDADKGKPEKVKKVEEKISPEKEKKKEEEKEVEKEKDRERAEPPKKKLGFAAETETDEGDRLPLKAVNLGSFKGPLPESEKSDGDGEGDGEDDNDSTIAAPDDEGPKSHETVPEVNDEERKVDEKETDTGDSDGKHVDPEIPKEEKIDEKDPLPPPPNDREVAGDLGGESDSESDDDRLLPSKAVRQKLIKEAADKTREEERERDEREEREREEREEREREEREEREREEREREEREREKKEERKPEKKEERKSEKKEERKSEEDIDLSAFVDSELSNVAKEYSSAPSVEISPEFAEAGRKKAVPEHNPSRGESPELKDPKLPSEVEKELPKPNNPSSPEDLAKTQSGQGWAPWFVSTGKSMLGIKPPSTEEIAKNRKTREEIEKDGSVEIDGKQFSKRDAARIMLLRDNIRVAREGLSVMPDGNDPLVMQARANVQNSIDDYKRELSSTFGIIDGSRESRVIGGSAAIDFKKNTLQPMSALTTNRVLETLKGDNFMLIPTVGHYVATDFKSLFGTSLTFNNALAYANFITQFAILGCATTPYSKAGPAIVSFTRNMGIDYLYTLPATFSAEYIIAHKKLNDISGKIKDLTLNHECFPREYVSWNDDVADYYGIKMYSSYQFEIGGNDLNDLSIPANFDGTIKCGYLHKSHNAPILNRKISEILGGREIHSIGQVLTAMTLADNKTHLALKLGLMSHYIRSGLKSKDYYELVENILPIQEDISLPAIKVKNRYTAQGHGPILEISKLGKSRTGFGYEITDFLNVFEKIANYVKDINEPYDYYYKHTTNTPDLNSDLSAKYSSLVDNYYLYIDDEYSDLDFVSEAAWRSSVAKIPEFANLASILPKSNIKTMTTFSKKGTTGNIVSFMQPPYYEFGVHKIATGHTLAHTILNASVAVTGVYHEQVTDHKFISTHNSDAHITPSTLILKSTLPFKIVMLYSLYRALLNVLIPDEMRVDLILTNMLFSGYTINGKEAYLYSTNLSPSEHYDLFVNMAERCLKFISNTKIPYKPFDATFYTVPQLHNICFNYGAEGAAAGLSALWYPSLIKAFKIPCICLPLDFCDEGQNPLDKTIYATKPDAERTALDSISASITNLISDKYKIILQTILRATQNAKQPLEAIIKVMPSLMNKLFDVADPGGLRFTYTRGTKDYALNINVPITANEVVQMKKSIAILAQHMSLVAAVTYASGNQLVKTGNKATKHITYAKIVEDSILRLRNVKGIFFNATIAYSLSPHLANTTSGIGAHLLSKQATYPVKFGLGAFNKDCDSFNRLEKPTNTWLFDSSYQNNTIELIAPTTVKPNYVMFTSPALCTYAIDYAENPDVGEYWTTVSDGPIKSVIRGGELYFPAYNDKLCSSILLYNTLYANYSYEDNIESGVPIDVSAYTYSVDKTKESMNSTKVSYPTAQYFNLFTLTKNKPEAGRAAALCEPTKPIINLSTDKVLKVANYTTHETLSKEVSKHLSSNLPIGCMEVGMPINYCSSLAYMDPHFQLATHTAWAWSPYNVCGMSTALWADATPRDCRTLNNFNPVTSAFSKISQLYIESLYLNQGDKAWDPLPSILYKHMMFNGLSAGYYSGNMAGCNIYRTAAEAYLNKPLNDTIIQTIHDPTSHSNINLLFDVSPSKYTSGGGYVLRSSMGDIYSAHCCLKEDGYDYEEMRTIGDQIKNYFNRAEYTILPERLALSRYRVWAKIKAESNSGASSNNEGRKTLDKTFTFGQVKNAMAASSSSNYTHIPIGVFSPQERLAISDWSHTDNDLYHKRMRNWYFNEYKSAIFTYNYQTVPNLSVFEVPHTYTYGLRHITGDGIFSNKHRTTHNYNCFNTDDPHESYKASVRGYDSNAKAPYVHIVNSDQYIRDRKEASGFSATDLSVTLNSKILLSYLKDSEVQSVAMESVKASSNYRVLGKLRFDTVLVRNLVHIHLVYNIAAKEVLDKLVDLGREPVFGKTSFHPSLTQYTNNASQSDVATQRAVDRTSWSAVPFN